MSEQPDITIIVTIIDGGDTLKSCLEALERHGRFAKSINAFAQRPIRSGAPMDLLFKLAHHGEQIFGRIIDVFIP